MNLLSLKLSRVETQILIFNLQLFYHVNLVAKKILAAMKPKEKKIFAQTSVSIVCSKNYIATLQFADASKLVRLTKKSTASELKISNRGSIAKIAFWLSQNALA